MGRSQHYPNTHKIQRATRDCAQFFTTRNLSPAVAEGEERTKAQHPAPRLKRTQRCECECVGGGARGKMGAGRVHKYGAEGCAFLSRAVDLP